MINAGSPETPAPEADALVTKAPGVLLGVLTADCTPILMSDPEARVVAAVHAGWRGALAGVIESAVGAMESLGSRRGAIQAAIGPTISQASYEVGADMRDVFLDQSGDYEAFFEPGRDGRFQFDLEGFVTNRLNAAGQGSVERLGIDTYPVENRLFSYRRTTHLGEADYGRQISVIGIARG